MGTSQKFKKTFFRPVCEKTGAHHSALIAHTNILRPQIILTNKVRASASRCST